MLFKVPTGIGLFPWNATMTLDASIFDDFLFVESGQSLRGAEL
jgi:hypothetical protein